MKLLCKIFGCNWWGKKLGEYYDTWRTKNTHYCTWCKKIHRIDTFWVD